MGTQSVLTHISWNRIFAKAISSTQDYPRCRTTWTQTTRRESCPERPNNGGQVNSGSFAARAQSAADKNAAGTGNQPSGGGKKTDMWIKRGHHVVHNSYVSFRDF